MIINNKERLTMTVEEAGRALGISRPTAFKLANSGELPTIRMGKRLLVPRVQLERLLNGDAKVK
jgi:excisionase family DNA binding protein